MALNITPKILAFAGSTRKDSFNKKLVRIAVAGAKQAGAEVALIDLADYPLPLYDGDLEEREGLPEKAKELKKIFIEHDGFLISSPEYNSSISGVLKNTIDWVSRPEPSDTVNLAAFRGKSAALMSASPGGLGGLRGLVHLRALLNNIFVLVIPEQVSISQASEAFDANGLLLDTSKLSQVRGLGEKLTQLLHQLKVN